VDLRPGMPSNRIPRMEIQDLPPGGSRNGTEFKVRHLTGRKVRRIVWHIGGSTNSGHYAKKMSVPLSVSPFVLPVCPFMRDSGLTDRDAGGINDD